MAKAITFYSTSIGKKAVMALSGLILYGFVIGHMLGNLQVFLGPERYNAYAEKLRGLGPLLWTARGILIVALLAHVIALIQLDAKTRAARPTRYRVKKNPTTSYAALTMRFGGIALLLFVIFHLVHFTVPGRAMSGAYTHSPTDVYANFINGFKVPWVTAIYVVAQLFLGMHLFHASGSLLQTLGFNDPRYNERRRFIGQTIGVAVAGGNIAMPIAVLVGLVK